MAMTNHGVGTASNAAMPMSSSSLGTEEDSDASFRFMYSQSRTAVADLSSLMEQSLLSFRIESLLSPSPFQHR
ncbi:hypothetical protein PsorP6_013854 [Peronosclerospora sorghi]|uniref:Uncharacterized protein n=1 Tax=Peronosclerospora sorghi TaxID=230839 RepID=A0ACC0VGI5_9STRA|nr:hypothetical protein PsorP6_013854 [Peronosclerospora sorghi]